MVASDGEGCAVRHSKSNEVRRIAANVAKLQSEPRQILKDIPRPPNSASRDD
jgi:hypothetical protein